MWCRAMAPMRAMRWCVTGRARHLVHRRHRHRQEDPGQRRRRQEILDGAGRQVAGAGVRRRRRRARAGRGAVHHLLAQRRALHRGLAHLRAGNHLRRFRAPLRRAREPAGGGRPDRRAYPCRFDDHAPALGKGHWLHPSGRGRGRPRAGGRSNCPPACRRGWLAATSCVPRCWPTWTTACAAPRKRSSARSPACCPSRTRSTA